VIKTHSRIVFLVFTAEAHATKNKNASADILDAGDSKFACKASVRTQFRDLHGLYFYSGKSPITRPARVKILVRVFKAPQDVTLSPSTRCVPVSSHEKICLTTNNLFVFQKVGAYDRGKKSDCTQLKNMTS